MSKSTPPVGEDRLLATFAVASEPGNERLARDRVAEIVSVFDLEPARLERLKTAVAEATMNAIEHGNGNRPELDVEISVALRAENLVLRITDQGQSEQIPAATAPDLDAKLAGLQSPRGWGLFLIRNMVDDLHVDHRAGHHCVQLTIALEGDSYGHDRA
ncbi:MAG: ATP-binding protein [Egibacteraceae bacterium]